jgi:hypothetical protein
MATTLPKRFWVCLYRRRPENNFGKRETFGLAFGQYKRNKFLANILEKGTVYKTIATIQRGDIKWEQVVLFKKMMSF